MTLTTPDCLHIQFVKVDDKMSYVYIIFFTRHEDFDIDFVWMVFFDFGENLYFPN